MVVKMFKMYLYAFITLLLLISFAGEIQDVQVKVKHISQGSSSRKQLSQVAGNLEELY